MRACTRSTCALRNAAAEAGRDRRDDGSHDERRRPTAARRAVDTLAVLLVISRSGRLLHRIAGETALPAPIETMSYLAHMMATRALCRKRRGDGGGLRACAYPRLRYRACHRHMDGRASALGRRRRADPGRALFAAEDHALSGGAAHLRPRYFGQGGVRRHARHSAGGTAHHGRDPRHPAGLPARGAHLAAVAVADHRDGAPARGAARSVHRPAHRFHRDAARRAARRNVRLQGGPRFDDHERHVARAKGRK